MKRMMSSFNPGGAESASISVVNPYLYSSRVTWSTVFSCVSGFMSYSSNFRVGKVGSGRPDGRLGISLEDPFFHFRFGSDQIGQPAFSQIIRHGEGQTRQEGPDGAIHGVDAALMFPRGAGAVFLFGEKFSAQHFQYVVHVDLPGIPGQLVTAALAPGALDQPAL